MERNMINGQGAAAKNSANVSYKISAYYNMGCYHYESIVLNTIDGADYQNVLKMAKSAIRNSGKAAHFILEFGDERYCIYLRKNSDGEFCFEVSETSSKTMQRPVAVVGNYYCGGKRLTSNNIENIANVLCDIIADYLYGVYEADAENIEVEISDAPMLEEAPCLEDFCTYEASKIMAAGLTSVALTNEEFYMYDYDSLYDYLVDAGFDSDRAYEIRNQYKSDVDRAIRTLLTDSAFVPVEVSEADVDSTERFYDEITFPYSAKGLAYVKENTKGVDMADILKEVAEFHWDFESVVKESRWTRFTNDSFKELIWATCWAEYLVVHTDEVLEAETRYVLGFDSVYDDLFGDLWPYMTSYDDSCGGCELWVDVWGVVERAAEIIKESVGDSGTRCIYWDNFPDYVMTAFLGDLYGFETFTERVMSELEGGDIVDILPYDDGLYLSFVGDEVEVAA